MTGGPDRGSGTPGGDPSAPEGGRERGMRLYPAVDLLDGSCVRLYRGSYDRATRYSRDPVAVARRFVEEGARALHVVDLDGAREGRPVSRELVLSIRSACDVPLQVGGGLRETEHVDAYLEAGVERVILGTAALERPEWLGELVERYGPRAVAASVDVRGDEVVVEGWTEGSGVSRADLLERLAGLGVETILYTDTTRDGTLTAPDVEGAREVVRRGFRTVAAGGVSDVSHLRELRRAGVRAAVVGSALYEGRLTIPEALAACGDGDGSSRPASAPAPGEKDREDRDAG